MMGRNRVPSHGSHHSGYTEAENAEKQQPLVEAYGRNIRQPDGADKTS
jgi:hypothetical protein